MRNKPSRRNSERAVIGIHAVKEALQCTPVRTLWLRTGWTDSQDLSKLEALAKQKRIKMEVRALGELNKIAESHQGAICFATSQPEFDWNAIHPGTTDRLVFLDGVEDPHNLGAVLRTAWLLGVKGVFIPESRSASIGPAASKVAQGAIEHVPVTETNLAEALADAKEHGFWTFGLSHRSSKSIYDLRLPEKVVWVLGSEASGIRKPIERACDELVSIPQLLPDASYNVSVAAAMALGETYRQHQISEKPGK